MSRIVLWRVSRQVNSSGACQPAFSQAYVLSEQLVGWRFKFGETRFSVRGVTTFNRRWDFSRLILEWTVTFHQAALYYHRSHSFNFHQARSLLTMARHDHFACFIGRTRQHRMLALADKNVDANQRYTVVTEDFHLEWWTG